MMYIVAKHLEYPGKHLMLAYESTHKSLLSLQIVQCLTKGMLRDTHAHTFMYTVRVSAWPVISIWNGQVHILSMCICVLEAGWNSHFCLKCHPLAHRLQQQIAMCSLVFARRLACVLVASTPKPWIPINEAIVIHTRTFVILQSSHCDVCWFFTDMIALWWFSLANWQFFAKYGCFCLLLLPWRLTFADAFASSCLYGFSWISTLRSWLSPCFVSYVDHIRMWSQLYVTSPFWWPAFNRTKKLDPRL